MGSTSPSANHYTIGTTISIIHRKSAKQHIPQKQCCILILMNKNKAIGIAVVVGVTILVGIMLTQPKKIKHTYDPVTDIEAVKKCVEEITGKPKLDIEELSQNEQLLNDVNRFCLKTVEDKEAILIQLTQ